ncbi:MAG: hypothetical protein HUK05_02665 [Prevotella sp.]|nr:hypothetical protein [Prevotella sp.]MCF0208305.1 hypothetical protein [Bacteroidaceae bacterium]
MSFLSRLIRMPRTRGFGVQSPTDYHFLRHIVSQQLPYYAYKQLENITTHLSKREIEILRFYLRLANYVQDSQPIYIIGKDNFGNINFSLRKQFFTAGCRKAIVQQASRIPTSLNEDSVCVLIIESLDNKISMLKTSSLSKVVFDMDDIAVAFCTPKRHKIIYKINL